MGALAFFDVDETLINTKSMFEFYEYWCNINNAPQTYKTFMSAVEDQRLNGESRSALNRFFYREFRGIALTELSCAGHDWSKHALGRPGFFHERVVERLRSHQASGDGVVLVSGSMPCLLENIKLALGVEAVLCTQLLVDENGILTGEIGSPQTIGSGKRVALEYYCHKKNVDPLQCFAYGDDISDIEMLESTGNPRCVGDNSGLADIARLKQWEIIRH